VGAPGANRAVLLSGSNGSTLASLSAPTHAQLFGLAVTGLPDLDQDGIADYAIGAPEDAKQAAQTGAIFLYSGKTSTLLRRIEAPEQGMQFGWSICDMGDWNGDGIADLGVGAPRTWNYNYLHWGMGRGPLWCRTQDGAVLFRHDTKDLWANEGEFVHRARRCGRRRPPGARGCGATRGLPLGEAPLGRLLPCTSAKAAAHRQ
jgi:hypothetical protein